MPKKILLFALSITFYMITHAQSAGWMMGTWKSARGTTKLSGNVTNTIHIDDVSGESFTGTKTSETNDGLHGKITIAIAGFIRGKELYLQNGAVVRKEPENVQWYDCSACTQANKLIISRDSLILINTISGCDNRCDAETFYYRLLSEYDSPTQRYLVDWFGRPADIIGFRPFHPQEDNAVTSKDDNEPLKNDVAASAITTVTTDAIKQAAKRHQDSLDNIARIRQQQIDDSTLLAQQKKREQEIADSINLAKQREQQRITDSLAAIRRQEYNDSLQKAALAKAVSPATTDSTSSAANQALTSRTSVLLETYHITSPDILIELFDNGEIDGDRVSVYHNKTIIVNNQMLNKTPITLNIHADAANREHEFVLVAENLGSIPPNSALMRITAGKQIYKLSVNTDMKTNARIVFYYDGN